MVFSYIIFYKEVCLTRFLYAYFAPIEKRGCKNIFKASRVVSAMLNKKLLFAPWACRNKNYGSGQISEKIFRKIFKDLIVFDPQEVLYLNGREEMNRLFLETVQKEQPDYILLWLIYDEFSIETLLKIKEISPKTKIMNFFGDDDALFYNFSRYYAPIIDCCFVAQTAFIKEYKKEGIKNPYRLVGVDVEYYKPLAVEKNFDVTFIGTPKTDRYKLIKFLIDNGVGVTIFGAGWDKHTDLKEFYRGALSKEELVNTINQSKISLSFTKNYEGKPHYKGRVVEISACRSFLITEYFKGYYDLFSKDEIVMFNNEKDLLEKVKYYLHHEAKRESIANRAYKRVLKNYSLEKEIRQAINSLERIQPKKVHFSTGKQALYLTVDELKGTNDEIYKKVQDYEYVGFKERGSDALPYKDYLQIYSLEKSGKDISCCDYYVHSRFVGDYLGLLNAHYACKTLDKSHFDSLIFLSQLVVKKGYFIKNLEDFRMYASTKNISLDKNRIAFVSIPLLRVQNLKKIPENLIWGIYKPIFEDKLRPAYNAHGIFASAYLYKLLLFCIFTNKGFIIRRLLKKSGKVLA